MKNTTIKNSRIMNGKQHNEVKKSSRVVNVNLDELQNYFSMLSFQNQPNNTNLAQILSFLELKTNSDSKDIENRIK